MGSTSRAANLLVDQHGADAPIRAAQRADELLAGGDMRGRAVWLGILKAVEELMATKPPTGCIERPCMNKPEAPTRARETVGRNDPLTGARPLKKRPSTRVETGHVLRQFCR